MANYSLLIKASAAKQLAGLPLRDRKRLVARIRGLAIEPRPAGAERLSGQEKYRVRQGDYRVLYLIDPRVHAGLVTLAAVELAQMPAALEPDASQQTVKVFQLRVRPGRDVQPEHWRAGRPSPQ